MLPQIASNEMSGHCKAHPEIGPVWFRGHPLPLGASGNFRAGEQWAGRVCSVICQVHMNIFVAVKTGPISAATVVVPRVLCLGGPCAGLHRSRLAQSAPVGVLSSALVVSKALHLSPKSWLPQEHEGVSAYCGRAGDGIRVRHSSIRITFENGWHTKRHHHPARNPRYPACFRDSPNPRRTRAKQQISLTKPPKRIILRHVKTRL